MSIIVLSALVEMCGSELGVFRKGEKAFQESHVQSMTVDGHYIWGTVSASQRKGVLYTVKLFTSENGGNIVDKSCTCARGQHFCHHMVALGLHAVNNVSKTDLLCQWKKPKLVEASTSTQTMYPSEYEACPAAGIPEEKLKADLQKAAPLSSTMWILSDEPPAATTIVDQLSIEAILFSPEFIASDNKHQYVLDSIGPISVSQVKDVEAVTRGQAKNMLWHKIKKFRISSSNFGLVLPAIERGRYPPSLFKTLLGEYALDGVKSVQWGINHEKVAISCYEQLTNHQVQDAGFILHPSGFLGASPDGFVGHDRVVEVKCPYSIKDQSIVSALSEKYFLKQGPNGGIALNLENPQGARYYHQVQGILHISQRKFCDLIIWTTVDCCYTTIAVDSGWVANLDKLNYFYKNVFVNTFLL